MRRVVVLAEAAGDLEEAQRFYDEREAGIGDYCVTSLLADLASLAFFHGIHRRHANNLSVPLYFEILSTMTSRCSRGNPARQRIAAGSCGVSSAPRSNQRWDSNSRRIRCQRLRR